MTKKIKTFLIILLSVILFYTISFSHSGGTDSEGGHTNHSTGEYHYHHGYPAHQHTNGVCPYDFKNNTQNATTSVNGVKIQSENKSYKYGVFIILLIIGFKMSKMLWQSYQKKKSWNLKRDEYSKLYTRKNLFKLCNIPENINFDELNLPLIQDESNLRWGKKYTVFVTKTGISYHHKKGCSNSKIETHLFSAIRKKSACKKCVKSKEQIPQWYIEYIKIQKIKQMYKIE